jgi:putative membrane protein
MALLMIILAIIVGCGFGIITGITPGVHINLVAAIMLGMLPTLLKFVDLTFLVVLIVSMSIAHTFLDFIPSCYLGAPDDETALAALPGHVMLLQGRAFEAVKLTTIGSLLSLVATVIIAPILIFAVPFIWNNVKNYVGYLLIALVIFMIARSSKKIWSIIIFLFSGLFGILVFSLNLSEPLFPMLSGLFGISMLLVSLNENVNIPEQKITDEKLVNSKEAMKAVGAATISGSLVSIFPTLGATQAAIIVTSIMKNIAMYPYMILMGGINTVSMVVALITFYTIDKARNGSIAVVQTMIQTITLEKLLMFFAVSIIAGAIATFLTLKISKIFSKFIIKVNYKLLCIFIIAFVSLLVLIMAGPIGFLVLLVSTAIGLIPNLTETGRNMAMGCLILPVILYFVL